MSYYCPRCKDSILEQELFNKKIIFTCKKCHGHFITIHALNSFPKAKEFTSLLWQGAKYGDYLDGIKCPECGHMAKEVTFEINNNDVNIDICTSCQFVWFDYQELNYVNTKNSDDDLPQEFKEIVAQRRIEMEQSKLENDFGGIEEDYSFSNYFLSLLNLPIEENQTPLKNKPIITWILCLFITIVFLASLINKSQIIQNFGFIPNYFFRYYGLTLLTGALLHSNIFHLLGNLYFLFVFGDNVEDFLGKKKYLFLILFSEIGAILLHTLLENKSNIPTVGSSGFISGIIAAYTLLFPKVRLTFRWFYKAKFSFFTYNSMWISLPVWLVFGIWIISQVIMIIYLPVSNIAYFAHLGGALFGIIFIGIDKIKEKHNFFNNKDNSSYIFKNKSDSSNNKPFDNKSIDSSSYR